MKFLIYLLAIFIVVTCSPDEKQKPKFDRKEMEKKVIECVENSEKASNKLKELLKENKEKGFRKMFREIKNTLDIEDKKIVKDCRKQVFGDWRKSHKADL